MIHLLAPWALAGAVLLAGPLLVHLLLRRNARRVLFPATHFLRATRAAAVRFRRPSDLALMTLRLAIVGSAVVAIARPIVVTPRRLAEWNARIVRAVIVDTGSGMSDRDQALRLGQEEMGAFHSQRFASGTPRDALARAAAWFRVTPPGRREAVIISDFQRGAIDEVDLAMLPPGVGVRLIRAGTQPSARDITLPAVTGFRGGTWQPSLRVEKEATAVTWTRTGGTAGVSWLTTLQAATEADAAARAVAAAAALGVAGGDAARQVRIKFAGAPLDPPARGPVRERWMVDAALALRRSALLGETAATVTAGEQDGRLLVETTASAASVEAAAVVRAVILAVRHGSIADRAAEVATVSDAELAAWRREPAPVASTPAEPSVGIGAGSDARWFWALALVLLALEARVRRVRIGSKRTEIRDAA